MQPVSKVSMCVCITTCNYKAEVKPYGQGFHTLRSQAYAAANLEYKYATTADNSSHYCYSHHIPHNKSNNNNTGGKRHLTVSPYPEEYW